MALGLIAYEGMNETKNRETRRGRGVGNRCPATIGVPAEDLARKAQAAHGVSAGGELHAAGRQLKNVGAAGGVEHVRPIEEARECLAVIAVADEPEAARRRNVARYAAHVTAPATKLEV